MSRWPDAHDHWVDPVAVERAVRERAIGRELTASENREAARILARRGLTVSQIAERLHTRATVVRGWIEETP